MNKNKSLRPVAALFTRKDSIYVTLAGVDCWPKSRNAMEWPGGAPVVAHPPCRSWGRFSHWAKPEKGETGLAPWAVFQVQQFGGVLEHPESSKLWKYCMLPRPGAAVDKYGGWTLSLDQYWFGHEAQKRTWLYIVGVGKKNIHLPFALGQAPKVVSNDTRGRRKKKAPMRPEISKADCERTPPKFARWLVDIARRSRVGKDNGDGNEKKSG